MGKTFHPECFSCAYCGKLFANTPFYLEDGLPYCEEGRRPLQMDSPAVRKVGGILKDGLPSVRNVGDTPEDGLPLQWGR
jgi:hypothetical protein